MARSILAGHFGTFYWGQQYGGAETYLVAAVLWLVHGSPTRVWMPPPALLSAVAAALVGLIVAGGHGARWLGAVAGAVAWVWPYAVVWNSVRETGFRAVLPDLRPVAGLPGRAGPSAGAAGVAVQLSCWGWRRARVVGLARDRPTSPCRPACCCSPPGTARSPPAGRWAAPWQPGPALAAVGGAVVGALPWLYTNLHTGFASLSTGSLPTYGATATASGWPSSSGPCSPSSWGSAASPAANWVGGATSAPSSTAWPGRGGRPRWSGRPPVPGGPAGRTGPGRGRRGAGLPLPLCAGPVERVLARRPLRGVAPAAAGPAGGRGAGWSDAPSSRPGAGRSTGGGGQARHAGAPVGGAAGRCRSGRGGPRLRRPAGHHPADRGRRPGRRGPGQPRHFLARLGRPRCCRPRQVAAGLTAHGIRDAYGDYWTA